MITRISTTYPGFTADELDDVRDAVDVMAKQAPRVGIDELDAYAARLSGWERDEYPAMLAARIRCARRVVEREARNLRALGL